MSSLRNRGSAGRPATRHAGGHEKRGRARATARTRHARPPWTLKTRATKTKTDIIGPDRDRETRHCLHKSVPHRDSRASANTPLETLKPSLERTKNNTNKFENDPRPSRRVKRRVRESAARKSDKHIAPHLPAPLLPSPVTPLWHLWYLNEIKFTCVRCKKKTSKSR